MKPVIVSRRPSKEEIGEEVVAISRGESYILFSWAGDSRSAYVEGLEVAPYERRQGLSYLLLADLFAFVNRGYVNLGTIVAPREAAIAIVCTAHELWQLYPNIRLGHWRLDPGDVEIPNYEKTSNHLLAHR